MALTGEKLADSEVIGSSITPDMFPNPFRITSSLGWLRGLPELDRRWPWRAAALRFDGLVVSSDGKPRQALLRL